MENVQHIKSAPSMRISTRLSTYAPSSAGLPVAPAASSVPTRKSMVRIKPPDEPVLEGDQPLELSTERYNQQQRLSTTLGVASKTGRMSEMIIRKLAERQSVRNASMDMGVTMSAIAEYETGGDDGEGGEEEPLPAPLSRHERREQRRQARAHRLQHIREMAAEGEDVEEGESSYALGSTSSSSSSSTSTRTPSTESNKSVEESMPEEEEHKEEGSSETVSTYSETVEEEIEEEEIPFVSVFERLDVEREVLPYPDEITEALLMAISVDLGQIRLCWPKKEKINVDFMPSVILPDGYLMNTNKEKVLLLYCENFRVQYHARFPNRKPLLLCGDNIVGQRKMVCTTLRPTTLPHPDLSTWQELASFVADHITYERLDPPTKLSQPPTQSH